MEKTSTGAELSPISIEGYKVRVTNRIKPLSLPIYLDDLLGRQLEKNLNFLCGQGRINYVKKIV